jgi:hypothetical protein
MSSLVAGNVSEEPGIQSSSAPKMQTQCSSETLVPIYRTTRCHKFVLKMEDPCSFEKLARIYQITRFHNCLPCKLRRYVLPKRRYPSARLRHGVMHSDMEMEAYVPPKRRHPSTRLYGVITLSHEDVGGMFPVKVTTHASDHTVCFLTERYRQQISRNVGTDSTATHPTR